MGHTPIDHVYADEIDQRFVLGYAEISGMCRHIGVTFATPNDQNHLCSFHSSRTTVNSRATTSDQIISFRRRRDVMYCLVIRIPGMGRGVRRVFRHGRAAEVL